MDAEDVMAVAEGYMKTVFKEVLGIDLPTPLPRMTYSEAMERYGTDKPDTRFGLEIRDLTEAVRGCGFAVFSSAVESGGTVRAITAENAADVLTRKEIDNSNL